MTAVRNHDEVVVRLLLEKGALPDLTIEFGIFTGESPMSIAEVEGLEATAKLMQSYVRRE